MSDTAASPVLSIIGGTGALGSALAMRWLAAGFHVVIGSRDSQKANEAAHQMAIDSGRDVTGCDNAQAAQRGDIVILTVPWSSHSATLDVIAPHVDAKLVVDTTVPLVPPKVAVAQLPEAGSAAVTSARRLGEGVTVVSGFHNVAATKLAAAEPVDADVLVFGDTRAGRDRLIELVEATGLRGIHGGALANSAAAEALTSVLISINKRYKSPGAGIRITGI